VLTIGLLLAAVLVLVALPMASSISGVQVTSWGAAPIAAFFFPLIGFCIAPVYPAINSVILSALPTHQHGSMAGLIVVFSALGGTSGSIITGFLFEAVGGQRAFYFSLLPIAAILFTLYLFKRKAEELGHA
jgi:FHS family glucose/mannose:H+ symporter-like MFS transporter